VKETDAIFAEVTRRHALAAASDETVRLSIDTKATVKIGPFSRGGYSRTGTQGADHDFQPTGKLTPFGLFQPATDELDLYVSASQVTSDLMVDCLEDWWQRHRDRLAATKTLLLDLDNGPENHSRRSQFLKRLIAFAWTYQVRVVLCYYPPYHSKYNPIERCWGILENYWRGELLASEAAVLGYAANMTYNGKHPHVVKVAAEYRTGVRLTRQELDDLEPFVQRTDGLRKWSVVIPIPATKPGQPIF
jgi:hypothetical protein